MATVTKNFKVKSGLVVEGATATVGGQDVLTKKQDDQDYIVGLIGGTATSANEANKVVKRDGNGNFAATQVTADLVGDVTGNADTATALETARTIELTGDVTGSVSFDGTANVQISATIDADFATDLEVATAKSEAISDAASSVDAKVGDNTVDGTAGNTVTARIASAAAAAQAAAEATAAADATTKANAALAAAEIHANTAIANLVDSAPATLDTLNELAAALQDNPDIISDLQGIAAGKQDTLTAGSNIDITNDVISVTGLTSAEISDFNSAALSATSAAYDVAGAAATAEANAIAHADALDTDDIAEGSAQYFTDTRAKTAAAALITGATKTNIVITGDENGLTITAENGVADSTTSDLAEGSNLYFTDARAVSALEAVTPNFVEVDLNSVAKQVAATSSAATASTVTAYSWAKADFRSAKFLVKVSTGTHSDVSEVILTLDSSDNVAITEYAMVGTNGALSTVSADVSGNNVRLLVTTTENNSNVTVAGTLLA